MIRRIIQLKLKVLAKLVLWKYKPFIVAITGSVGKSSTKEAVFSVLSHHFPKEVRKTEKNLNTEIGLPLTIIGGRDAKRNIFIWLANFLKGIAVFIFPVNYPKILVLEMAADKPGDISYLCSIAKPDIAIITAIGEMPVHLEFFPSRDAYVNEKAEIIRALKTTGKTILNYDDELVRELAGTNNIFFGFDTKAKIRASHPSYLIPSSGNDMANLAMNFKMEYDGKTIPSKINGTLGAGAIYSALAATAVGLEMGINILEISKSLESLVPLFQRINFLKGIKNTILIDDTYNASPLSMRLALDVLSEFKQRRKVAVIGDMRELGVNTERAHREIALKANEIADIIFLVGDNMVFAREEIEKERNVFYFRNGEEAKMKVQELLEEGDVVLIKGSRAVKMDVIVEEIKEI